MQKNRSAGAEIRGRLDHPVIDADGHIVEITPLLSDYVKEIGGADLAARFARDRAARSSRTLEDCRESWDASPRHWTFPARNTLDRGTAFLPQLYHSRMDDLGLDFSLVYPTYGLVLQTVADDEIRVVGCRALNTYMADLHREYADRLAPVASLPMHTPEEAIEELEYAVHTLGMRAALIPSYVLRPIDRVHRHHPELDGIAYRPDTYGIDSEHDYDPVWAKFVELKVVPSAHGATMGMGFRRSISNYVYNHIGNFATSCEALCKSLLMGGVFHRFPELRIAALEGGMGWAASLYADFLGHWGKRNPGVIDDLNPDQIDGELLEKLLREYGNEWIREHVDVVKKSLTARIVPHQVDEFSACPFETAEQVRDLFTSRIYIGCEADDPMNALAFDGGLHPHGARFRILFGSDISHWDVPDVSNVLVEAHELVDDGRISDADFREFVFENPARLYAGTNPDFFKGTRVEGAVEKLLAEAG